MVSKYALELKFSGMAIGRTLANTTAALAIVNGAPFALLVASTLIGISRQTPAAS